MRSLRTLTLLFALLLLLPGIILAWLGWQSTATFANLAKAAAVSVARDVAAEVASQLPSRERALEQHIVSILQSTAKELTASLPDHAAGTAMAHASTSLRARLPAIHGASFLTIRSADNSAWLPRAIAKNHVRRTATLLETVQLEAARLEAQGNSRAAIDHILALTTDCYDPNTLAVAWAMAASTAQRCDEPDAESLCDRLADMPTTAVLGAAPLSLVVLESHAKAQAHFTAAAKSHALDEVSAPTEVRAAWYGRSANASSYALVQAARVEIEIRPAAFIVIAADLPADCSLELAVSCEDWLAMLEPKASITKCTVQLSAELTAGPTDTINITHTTTTTPLRPDTDGTVAGTVHTRAGLTRLRVTNPAFADITNSSTQQRTLTAIGIFFLLTVMGMGILLVRRSIASERAARRLRDDFIANISHELKTPLTSIRLHAEMLSEAGVDDPTRKRYGAVVEAESARLSSLVEDLLDFSALERGQRRLEPSPVDLARAAQSLATSWRPLAHEAGVELKVEVPTDPVHGMADTTALSRILTNLLQNAWRHGRPPRTGAKTSSQIRICVLGSCAIEVRDNGPGIPPQERERIFERFHRGASATATDGSGIGLALSRELAEAIDGRLIVDDDGSETVFRLSLPPVPVQAPKL